MSVLILSHYGDVHAEAIAWALGTRDVPVVRWTISNFPARQSITARISEAEALALGIEDRCSGPDAGRIDDGMLAGVTAVWNRRLGRPAMDPEIDPSFGPFAKDEVRRFVASLPMVLAPNAAWINSPEAERVYEAKLPQLIQARRAGLRIPDTVITNDPAEVRALCERHGEVIYKAFRVPTWRTISDDGARLSITFTTPIGIGDIDAHADGIRFAPGIFQQHIAKRAELRVLVLGNRVLAGRIHSQETEAARMDWRASGSDVRLERVTLRPGLQAKILAFMNEAGLKFGCVDLIEPLEGEEVFLEVNQMGQFLWMDQADPKMKVMGAFCAFLASEAGYGPFEDASFPSFQEFRDSGNYSTFVDELDQEQASHQYTQTYEVA